MGYGLSGKGNALRGWPRERTDAHAHSLRGPSRRSARHQAMHTTSPHPTRTGAARTGPCGAHSRRRTDGPPTWTTSTLTPPRLPWATPSSTPRSSGSWQTMRPSRRCQCRPPRAPLGICWGPPAPSRRSSRCWRCTRCARLAEAAAAGVSRTRSHEGVSQDAQWSRAGSGAGEGAGHVTGHAELGPCQHARAGVGRGIQN